MIRTDTAARPTMWLTLALMLAIQASLATAPLAADDPGEPVAAADADGDADGDDLDRAIKELQQILNAKPEGAAAQQLKRDLNLTRNFMRQLDQYLARQDYNNILRQIPNWVRNMKTPEVRKVWLSVSVALRKRMQSRDRGIVEETEGLIEQAKQLCADAESPEQIDELADQLTLYRDSTINPLNSQSHLIRSARSKIDQAINFVNQWGRYLAARQAGDLPTALKTLHALRNRSSNSSPLLDYEALYKRQRALETMLRDKVTATVTSLRETVAEASDLDQLDKKRQEVELLYQQLSRTGTDVAGARQQLERLRNSLTQWVNVLYAREAGDAASALSMLNSLRSSSYRDHRLLPPKLLGQMHEQLLEAISAGQDTSGDAVAEAFDDADSAKALAKLARRVAGELEQAQRNDQRQELYALQQDVRHLTSMQRSIETRRFGHFWSAQNSLLYAGQSPHRWSAKVRDLARDMMLEAITLQAQLDQPPKLGEDGRAATMLLRLADEAAADEQWEKTHRLLEIYRQGFASTGSGPSWLSGELSGIRSYLVGRQLETLGLPAEAVTHYLNTVSQLGARIPRQQAATRLKAIQHTE